MRALGLVGVGKQELGRDRARARARARVTASALSQILTTLATLTVPCTWMPVGKAKRKRVTTEDSSGATQTLCALRRVGTWLG